MSLYKDKLAGLKYQLLFLVGIIMFGAPFVAGATLLLYALVLSGLATIKIIVAIVGMIIGGLYTVSWADRKLRELETGGSETN